MPYDAPLIPSAQERSFIAGVAATEAAALDVDELLAAAARSAAAADAPPAPTASPAGADRRRERFTQQAEAYRRLAAERRA
jgi:hypothetical protein